MLWGKDRRSALGRRTSDAESAAYQELYESFTRQSTEIEKLSTLREITLAIASTLDMDAMLAEIVKRIQAAVDARRVLVDLVDLPADRITPVAVLDGDDIAGRDDLGCEGASLSETVLGRVIQDKRICRYPERVLVPLFANDEAVGLIRVEEKENGEAFSAADEEFFGIAGAHIALGLYNARLYELAVTDGLTRLFVRRYFELKLQEQVELADRYTRPFSLAMIDIDHFKGFNDTYGHQTGDEVLRGISRIMQENVRNADIVCRYGGEEMAVIMPETDGESGMTMAEKLRSLIEKDIFLSTEGEQLSVTISLGVASYDRAFFKNKDELVEGADKALYQSKETGRNRATLYVADMDADNSLSAEDDDA
ncbi:diguanylate cyclase [Candidatus Hydrogenedentota bacterium]